LDDAGLHDVELSAHTRVARFTPRDDFARSLVSATPLAQTFDAAGVEEQQLILAHVANAVRDCDGDPHSVCFPLTTNVAVARVPADRQ
jgi:hypothetical protein